jgi:hypothetical protein
LVIKQQRGRFQHIVYIPCPETQDIISYFYEKNN